MNQKFVEAKLTLDAFNANYVWSVLDDFNRNYLVWRDTIDKTSALDCLCALAVYGNQFENYCFPLFERVKDVFELRDSLYPCISLSKNFVSNDITLGGGEVSSFIILTGPNMGGKSTLMRQIGLVAILAQIGAPVPASSVKISPIDRIFTRLGAEDDIIAGKSTFLVELDETANILKYASANSLILIDELGRGTGSHDGIAIAAAVVDFLASTKCRTLFSTHYHDIVDRFYEDSRIGFGQMSYVSVNNGGGMQEAVTFLYKYIEGICSKSYGFNVARLAGMKESIIERAQRVRNTLVDYV